MSVNHVVVYDPFTYALFQSNYTIPMMGAAGAFIASIMVLSTVVREWFVARFKSNADARKWGKRFDKAAWVIAAAVAYGAFKWLEI